MLEQIFSLATLISIIGVVGFRLAGKKVWWAWYVNIACQVLWVIFALSIEQYGLLIGVVFYTWVFSKNAYEWTMDHRDPYRGFDFNEVAMPVMDPERPPTFNLGFHINDSEVGEDGVRVIKNARVQSVEFVEEPPHPSWTVRSIVPPEPFKHRGEIPDESALSYTKEELLEAGRELASQRENLIAQGVDPSELDVPLAPTGYNVFEHPDGRVCDLDPNGHWITKNAGTEGPMNLGQRCGRRHDFDGD